MLVVHILIRMFYMTEYKNYVHRVKWFTRKNKTKIIRTLKRSSKRMTKTRQMTPQAICRHIVGKRTNKDLLHMQKKTSSDRRGELRGKERESKTTEPYRLPSQSICLQSATSCHSVTPFLVSVGAQQPYH